MEARSCLLIIDMQVGMWSLEEPPFRSDELLAKIPQLAERARAAGVPVICLQHAGPKDHCLEQGTLGWEIHSSVAPAPGDLTVVKKTADSFAETSLQQELSDRDVQRLIITGLQTEYCVDTTCRRASNLGYETILVGDAHSTWDTDILTAEQIIAHHNDLLGSYFVRVESAQEIEF